MSLTSRVRQYADLPFPEPYCPDDVQGLLFYFSKNLGWKIKLRKSGDETLTDRVEYGDEYRNGTIVAKRTMVQFNCYTDASPRHAFEGISFSSGRRIADRELWSESQLAMLKRIHEKSKEYFNGR